jgi:peptidoglycan/xylan/chitin deacetylase (PgdA/CDA1 family)/CelD/BcsL family acetyltransferase involved in cellulose biosynthesis
MKVIEIRQEAELAGLRDAWNGLLRASGSDTIFLTWEWLTAWWSAYGVPGELRILLFREDSGELVGIAPLRRGNARRYGRVYATLSFIGDGSADSDYLDFIIAAGKEWPVLEALWGRLQKEFVDGVLLELNEVPASSPNLPIVRELACAGKMVWSESDVACGVVSLAASWPDYLKQLAPRFRTKIRSVLRNLEGRENVQFAFCDSPEHVAELLPVLYDLHGRRWATEAKPGVFHWDRKRLFYDALSRLLLERGWLRFSALRWKGRVLACQYGFEYGNSYFQLQEGYEPASEHWNAGVGLRGWTIQRFIERGVRKYDFMGGVGRHKSDWGAETTLSKRLVFGNATAANLLFCRGPEWVVQVRQAIKQAVPQRWIEARDARQERQRRERAASSAEQGDWKRRVLSTYYYYSGAPFALRPVRDRYRLRTSGGIRLEKRHQPSVRIIYYHRINDERDPFFPAMSPAKFEEEVGFIARHYRIVNMSEALRRLSEGGPAEPVVVVTFDDGYADNYHFAYPILERYGIPATVFLTTGSIDSRVPLWFEKLALAVKTSPSESVDLEFNTPRRLSLATEKARLIANDQIYAYLRYLSDSERQDRLDEILRSLRGSDERERMGRMLTWDEIRALHRRGIKFGGHTVTHPFVSRLSPEQARWEAAECKRRIESELQSGVEHFAYPSGREMDFSPWNKEVIQAAGYRAALSTLWGMNYPDTDRMELRRGQPWETSRAAFAAKFDWYQWTDA